MLLLMLVGAMLASESAPSDTGIYLMLNGPLNEPQNADAYIDPSNENPQAQGVYIDHENNVHITIPFIQTRNGEVSDANTCKFGKTYDDFWKREGFVMKVLDKMILTIENDIFMIARLNQEDSGNKKLVSEKKMRLSQFQKYKTIVEKLMENDFIFPFDSDLFEQILEPACKKQVIAIGISPVQNELSEYSNNFKVDGVRAAQEYYSCSFGYPKTRESDFVENVVGYIREKFVKDNWEDAILSNIETVMGILREDPIENAELQESVYSKIIGDLKNLVKHRGLHWVESWNDKFSFMKFKEMAQENIYFDWTLRNMLDTVTGMAKYMDTADDVSMKDKLNRSKIKPSPGEAVNKFQILFCLWNVETEPTKNMGQILDELDSDQRKKYAETLSISISKDLYQMETAVLNWAKETMEEVLHQEISSHQETIEKVLEHFKLHWNLIQSDSHLDEQIFFRKEQEGKAFLHGARVSMLLADVVELVDNESLHGKLMKYPKIYDGQQPVDDTILWENADLFAQKRKENIQLAKKGFNEFSNEVFVQTTWKDAKVKIVKLLRQLLNKNFETFDSCVGEIEHHDYLTKMFLLAHQSPSQELQKKIKDNLRRVRSMARLNLCFEKLTTDCKDVLSTEVKLVNEDETKVKRVCEGKKSILKVFQKEIQKKEPFGEIAWKMILNSLPFVCRKSHTEDASLTHKVRI